MKRILIVTLSLVLVLALAMSANAGVRNTVHDFQSLGRRSSAQSVAIPGSQRGMCSYCHIPHVSKGDRLWPTPGGSQQNLVGLVGVLCASCHVPGVNNMNNSNSPGSESSSDGVNRTNDIYATGLINHVLVDDGIYANNTNQNYYGGASQFNQANRWPYCQTQGVDAAAVDSEKKIECSSCHNPHSQDYGASTKTVETDGDYKYGNDYLRAAMFNGTSGIAFCEYCHEEKNRNTATSGVSALNTIGTGTHPVGATADAGLAGQEDIHIESTERRSASLTGVSIVSSVLYDMGIGTGIGTLDSARTDAGIGTHLTGYDTGGVTCQSCHKVHGAPRGQGNAWQRGGNTEGSYGLAASPRYLAASDDGDCNILAVENDANGGTSYNIGVSTNWSYPTGKVTPARLASDYNDLCIDCHETTPSVGKNWKTVDNNALRNTPDGDGTIVLDSHPVNVAPDGVSESGFDLTVQDPGWNGKNAAWTNARWAGGVNVKGDDSFNVAGRFRGAGLTTVTRSEIVCLTCHAVHDGEPATPILRAKTKDYCSDCHTLQIGGVSHPVGYGSAMRDNPDAAVWPNGDNLPMSDYYLGTYATKSFNRPAQNFIVDMACFTCHAAHDGMDGFMLRVTDDNSRICTGCHTDIAAGGGENPSNYIAEYNDNDDGLGDVPITTGTSSAATRLGSHYTGTVTSTDNVIGEIRWTFSGAWTDTDSDTGTGPVKAQTAHWYGSANGQQAKRMQCQSCHTPHNAASGLVEPNSYDGSVAVTTGAEWDFPGAVAYNDYNFDPANPGTAKMAFTPTSALLLGNNAESKMCATCHWPRGTHVTTIYTVPAKPDPNRTGGDYRRRRDYCTRIEKYIITILNGEQEVQYNVYDLIATGSLYGSGANMDSVRTPESPTNFPPLRPGQWGIAANDGKMVCDSCHTPHAAATRSGAFILEAGGGDASTLQLANQRINKRNYQALCWRCHDK